jgi:hypothetical protein
MEQKETFIEKGKEMKEIKKKHALLVWINVTIIMGWFE